MIRMLTLAVLALASMTAAQAAVPPKARVMFFVGPDCGPECDSVRSMLKFRGVRFTEIDVTTLAEPPGKNKYGVSVYPSTLVGRTLIPGHDLPAITSTLAEVLGKDVLTAAEKTAMAGHFDKQGRPKVVMYGTGWCGYCKKERALLRARNIAFDDIDVEASAPAAVAYSTLKGTGFPLTYVGYRRFAGYQDTALLAAVSELSGKPPAGAR